MPVNFELGLVLLVFLVALRFITGRGAASRARALMMDRQNPAAAKHELHALFAVEEETEKAHRAELWQHAQTSVRAAKELRRRLQTDLEEEDEIRALATKAADKPSPEEWKQLQQDRIDLV
jgi:hypothetical protein